MSARSIREDEAGAAAPMRRPEGGYGPVVERLVTEARAAGAVFRFAEPVVAVRLFTPQKLKERRAAS